MDVKQSPTHCKGSQKFTFGANIQFSNLKVINWTSCAKSFIPIGSHLVIHFMISIGLKFVFNHLPRPLYLRLCTNLSTKSPHGWLIFLDSSYKARYHIPIVGCLIKLNVVTTLPCSTLISNFLIISVRRYVEILLLSLLFYFSISLLTLNSNP